MGGVHPNEENDVLLCYINQCEAHELELAEEAVGYSNELEALQKELQARSFAAGNIAIDETASAFALRSALVDVVRDNEKLKAELTALRTKQEKEKEHGC
jgi:hypothetical protein